MADSRSRQLRRTSQPARQGTTAETEPAPARASRAEAPVSNDRTGAVLDTLVPVRVGSRDAMSSGLDHETAFVLLHVDGVSSVANIVQMSGIGREEVARALVLLRERGLVLLEERISSGFLRRVDVSSLSASTPTVRPAKRVKRQR